MHHPTDRITHTTAFVTPVRNSLSDTPQKCTSTATWLHVCIQVPSEAEQIYFETIINNIYEYTLNIHNKIVRVYSIVR